MKLTMKLERHYLKWGAWKNPGTLRRRGSIRLTTAERFA
jgi:hypothetical protein